MCCKREIKCTYTKAKQKGRYGHGHDEITFCTSQMRKTITFPVWKWLKLPNVVVCQQGLFNEFGQVYFDFACTCTAGYAAVQIGSFLS
jgi:hypothetical protein